MFDTNHLSGINHILKFFLRKRMRYAIEVENLRKTYTVKEWAGLLRRKTRKIEALKGVSFKVKKGELVGYLGENGSGKSTTLKILTGILHPDAGKVKVLGFVPWEDRMEYTRHIGVVFGQKSALWWDLPVKDSLEMWAEIYEVPRQDYERVLEEFGGILGIQEIINQPVRKLSFGQRMKAEILSAMLHSPEVLFLDEPTIGVDVLAKEGIREFLIEVNKKTKMTIILTTHDLADVEALCDRVILLHKGEKVFDGKLKKLKRLYGAVKEVEIDFKPRVHKKIEDLVRGYEINVFETEFVRFFIPEKDAKKIVSEILSLGDNVISFNVKEPSLEEVVKRLYAK